MPVIRSPLLLLFALLAWLCAAAPASAIRGLPLMQRYAANELPGSPDYTAVATDAQGVLYVGGGEGVMRFRGGDWELFKLPELNSMWLAADGNLYLGATNAFGMLHTQDDGRMQFTDLSDRFALRDGAASLGTIWFIRDTAQGIWLRTDAGLFLLGTDGEARHWTLPVEARAFLFDIDGVIHMRVQGTGLCRFEDGRLVPVPGGEAMAQRQLSGAFAWNGGALLVGEDGFWFADARGLRRLPSQADAEFPRHLPYSNLQLADGSFAIGSSDGMLMRFSPKLELLDRVELSSHTVQALGADREGGLWAIIDIELVRLRLPSPWTLYDRRHGLGDRLYDSAWYEDALWVANAHDVQSTGTRQPGIVPAFSPRGWAELEVYALEATEAGLLVGDRAGLHALDPGADALRPLHPDLPEVVTGKLRRSGFDPARVLAVGPYWAFWLSLKDGRWQESGRWAMDVDGAWVQGVHETAPGEFWVDAKNTGVQRWRIDAASGALLERRRFGRAEGLENGVRLLHLDGRLYAISGDTVRALDGERFVEAQLPPLPGLVRPWELESTDTELGTYVWTARQLWQRAPGGRNFRPIELGGDTAQGFGNVKLHGDGKLRIVTWNGLLQFDPDVPTPEPPPLRAALEKLAQLSPGADPKLLPLPPNAPAVLPPRSGMLMRLGMLTMEPDIEFRFRMRGFSDTWTAWNRDRDLAYSELPPGDYTYELEARTRAGRQAEPLSFSFRVEPMWSQTLWARLLFAGLALLALAAVAQGMVWLRYRKIVANNRELERKVSERTAELEAANRKLAELATADGLTGIANRRAMEQALAREWQRCRERGELLAVVMADVDNFKPFNDANGHLEGDAQLRRIAQAFAAETAKVDEVAARYGGEEFVLILPGHTLEQAQARAENVRRRVQETTAQAGKPSSVSLGVAALMPDADLAPSDLLAQADAALYRAKNQGRNRVEASGA